MKKVRFYAIKNKEYGVPLFYFKDLEGAMKMFRYLDEGEPVNIGSESIDKPIKTNKDGYRDSDSFDFIDDKAEDYQLCSVTREIYTKDEIENIRKERELKIKEIDRASKKRGKKK